MYKLEDYPDVQTFIETYVAKGLSKEEILSKSNNADFIETVKTFGIL